MRKDLDTLCDEISQALAAGEFTVFHAKGRPRSERAYVEWDVEGHPDFREFFAVAGRMNVRLIAFHSSKLSAEMLDRASEELEAASLEPDEERDYKNQIRTLRGYEGFVGSIQLSFDAAGTTYAYQLHAPWFEEFVNLLNELADLAEIGDEDDTPMSGYFSQN